MHEHPISLSDNVNYSKFVSLYRVGIPFISFKLPPPVCLLICTAKSNQSVIGKKSNFPIKNHLNRLNLMYFMVLFLGIVKWWQEEFDR